MPHPTPPPLSAEASAKAEAPANAVRARFLNVNIEGDHYLALPLTDEAAARLAARGLVYDCGDGHDLHLTPDHDWDVDDVAALLIALDDASRRP